MEFENLLPCPQEPATGLYPEPDELRPHPPILLSLRSIFILCYHLHLGLPGGLSCSGFPLQGSSLRSLFGSARYKSCFT
jgi:hypothetical protein